MGDTIYLMGVRVWAVFQVPHAHYFVSLCGRNLLYPEVCQVVTVLCCKWYRPVYAGIHRLRDAAWFHNITSWSSKGSNVLISNKRFFKERHSIHKKKVPTVNWDFFFFWFLFKELNAINDYLNIVSLYKRQKIRNFFNHPTMGKFSDTSTANQ